MLRAGAAGAAFDGGDGGRDRREGRNSESGLYAEDEIAEGQGEREDGGAGVGASPIKPRDLRPDF